MSDAHPDLYAILHQDLPKDTAAALARTIERALGWRTDPETSIPAYLVTGGIAFDLGNVHIELTTPQAVDLAAQLLRFLSPENREKVDDQVRLWAAWDEQ